MWLRLNVEIVQQQYDVVRCYQQQTKTFQLALLWKNNALEKRQSFGDISGGFLSVNPNLLLASTDQQRKLSLMKRLRIYIICISLINKKVPKFSYKHNKGERVC